MRIRILQVETNEEINAVIKEAGKVGLPSVRDGWRFDFRKHAKSKGAQTYILVTEATPGEIEGCLIYKMLEDQQPYMAYIEIAPHNKHENRKYDLIAGCLIAYACRLRFQLGRGDYLGWLAFDVLEENKSDQIRLMALYSKKYGAMRFADTTTMIIQPVHGEKLIAKYLG